MTDLSLKREEIADEPLWAAFARNVRVNLLAEMFSQGVRVGGFIFLARNLLPADFGILRVLITSTLLVGLVAGAGIPDAIIQRKELSADHEATAWWLNLALSMGSATLLYLIAGLIATAMAMPILKSSLIFLAVPLFFDSTSSIANARLRRQLRFRALALADFSAELAFVLAALFMIWLGLPRWSLVAALGARLMLHGLLVWCNEPYLPRRGPKLFAAKDLFRFSASVWGGRFLGALSGNADYLLVGRLLGSQTLGYYVIAWDLLRFVPDRLYYVAGRVTLPTFCRLQHDNRALARAYQDFTGYLAKLILPIMTCAGVAAPYVIVGLYGDHWLQATTPLRILTIGLSLAGLRLAIGSIYYTKDHPSYDIYLHGVRLILIILAVTLSVRFGLIGVCVAMTLVESSVSIAGQMLAGWLIDMSLLDWVKSCAAGLRLASACGIAALVGVGVASSLQMEGIAGLVLIVLICLLCFVGFGMSTARELIQGAIAPEAIS